MLVVHVQSYGPDSAPVEVPQLQSRIRFLRCPLSCTSGSTRSEKSGIAADAVLRGCGRPQERVQRHTMEHIVDFVCFPPTVQILDAPVPQTVKQLPDVLQFFDRLSTVPEPVIEVPKISTEDVPMRAVLRATQLAEQLVEVPTIVSYASLSLSQALHEYRQRTVEQNVDIPAVGGSGTGGGLSGFLPGQRYSMTAEQIVDTPVPRDSRVLHPASSSFGLPVWQIKGFFALFPEGKKRALGLALGGRNCSPSRAHPRRRLSWRISSRMQPVCGCAFQTVGGNFWGLIQKFGGLGEGWDGAFVMRQPTTTFGRISSCFPVLCARAVRTWNLVHFFLCPRFWQSLFWVSGLGVAYVYENWILREMTFLRGCNAWYNSGYMFCVSTLVALEEFTQFLRDGRLVS